MSAESSPSTARVAGAIVLIALVNIGALAAIATIVPLIGGAEPQQWFRDGGYLMYALVAVAGLQLLLGTSALTYAEIPRQLALAILGAGVGVMVAAGSTAALVRHPQAEQRGALRHGLVLAVVTLFVAAMALALTQLGLGSRPASVLWLTLWLGLHGLVLALGAPAIAGLARAPDAAARPLRRMIMVPPDQPSSPSRSTSSAAANSRVARCRTWRSPC